MILVGVDGIDIKLTDILLSLTLPRMWGMAQYDERVHLT